MCDEQSDSYLIHSDVFDENEENLQMTIDSVEFFVQNGKNFQIDDDGDFDLQRAERIRFILVHRNLTNLIECGYQLWNGALLLSDFILTNQSRFFQRSILELGAGIGLCSILASRYASRVISTDYNEEILNLIRKNIEINVDSCRSEFIQVQQFDWKDYESTTIDDSVEIILCADVIYDDDLTDLLFNVIAKMFIDKKNLQSIYISIEKRINFYSETNSVQCPAYEYFLEKLNILKININQLTIEQIQSDIKSIPQCTTIYQRTEQLVLWHIGHSERLKSSSS